MPSAAPRSPCSDLFSPSVSDAPHTRPTYVDAATLLIRGVTLAPCRYPDAMRTGVAALAAACLLSLAGCAGSPSASSSPTGPASVSSSVPAAVTASDTRWPDATPEPPYEPRKADWKIGIKILSKQCFGSAGCNVEYRIVPDYVGTRYLPESGTIEVTYDVKGAEDQITNTFTVEGKEASFDDREMTSVKTSKAVLVAVVTDVVYQPE